MSKGKHVNLPVSAAGAESVKQTTGADGGIEFTSGSAHQAKEGTVLNPGVRTIAVGTSSGATCPRCNRSGTLKVHMNKKVGRRLYCSECEYDQDKENSGLTGTTTVRSRRSGPVPVQPEQGVKILSAHKRG